MGRLKSPLFINMIPINFRNLPLANVPQEWIYKYYLSLDFRTKFQGQSIKIKSFFNIEKTASMFLYYKNGKYLWKDHSSGYGGDAIELVSRVFERSSGEASGFKTITETIQRDYNKWTKDNGDFKSSIIDENFYNYTLVCENKIRDYSERDIKYWGAFGVSQQLLFEHNVIPLDRYRLGKSIGQVTLFSNWSSPFFSYGYFEKDGSIIKIYNPFESYMKHVTLKNEILGREQIGNKKTLIIASSMKDLLTLKGLGLEIDVIAPMGEKVLIEANDIRLLKQLHTNVLTLFDNDRTGVKAMMLYKSIYDIDYVYIPFFKDIAEFRQKSSKDFAKRTISIAINKKITKDILSNETDQTIEPESRHPH